jgi:prepilin-type N-terminal cleavage/methylation domain-containing protein
MRKAENRVTSARAFTLVEILVVVIIMGIAAGVVIPMAIDSGDLQAAGGARILASDLQYAQNMAITTQTPVTVTFNAADDSYTLSNASGSLIHPMTKDAYTVDFNTTNGFSSVDMVSASFGGEAAVTFDELGAPDSPGSATIQAGDYTYQVTVSAATGRVTVAMTGS